MTKIIEVIADSHSGKSQSIILAARKAFVDGATLVAKYYRKTRVDIVEIYQFKTAHGLKYVAYASPGDNKEIIYENLYALKMFEDVARSDKHFVDYKDKALDITLNMPKSRHDNYKNMERVLKGIGKNFALDLIVMACHPDGAREEFGSLRAIHEYAEKKSYSEDTIEVSQQASTSSENMLNDIAVAIRRNAERIHQKIKEELQKN